MSLVSRAAFDNSLDGTEGSKASEFPIRIPMDGAAADKLENFKYDGEFKGKSTAMVEGVMWDGTTVWALYSIGESFSEALHRCIRDRVRNWQSHKAT